MKEFIIYLQKNELHCMFSVSYCRAALISLVLTGYLIIIPLFLYRICNIQISVPLRHITKHDIRVIPSERRELPAINSEAEARSTAPATPTPSEPPTRGLALSPTTAVRGIFPTSKNRSLKKKSSILASE